MIELRPHHLLCILGWRGHGYDAVFTENFTRVAEQVANDNEITLVEGPDAICASCPRRNDLAYGFEDKSEGTASGGAGIIDARLMDRLNLHIDETYGFDALVAVITAEIEPEDLAEVCAGCEWISRGWCAEGLSSARRFAQMKRQT